MIGLYSENHIQVMTKKTKVELNVIHVYEY